MAYWLGILVMAVMASCQKDNVMTDVEENLHNEKASLNMVFRATAPGPDEGMQQQTGMENLMVLLVDQKNTIVKGKIIDNIPEQESKLQTIIFDGLELGVYNLYAYANQPGLTFKENGTFDDTSKNQAFAVLTGTAVPDINGNQKLLTATKEVSIKVGENHTRLELKRTVAKMNMKIYNHSTADIKITDVNFSKFNSSTGYLFSHNGALPPKNAYRFLPPYNLNGEDQRIVANGSKEVYNTFLYESKAPAYTFGLSLDILEMRQQNYEFQPSILNTTDQFTLSANGYYLRANGEQLQAEKPNTPLDPDNVDTKFLWKFEKDGNLYRIRNVGNTSYPFITVYKPLWGSHQIWMENTLNKRRKFNLDTKKMSTWLSNNDSGKVIDLEGGTLTLSSSTPHTNWNYHRRVKKATPSLEEVVAVQKTVSAQQIKTVDRQTAHVAPLTQILRNQNVGIVLNIYYNEKTDDFNFQVEPWDKKDEEVEFN